MSEVSNSPARVAAVVPTYNRAQMLRECLLSLLAQTQPLAQIIVVDDGSTDDTAACIREFDDRVVALSQSNGGKPKGLNRALPLVSTEYVWLFDDDDIALPDSVERRVAALASQPQAGFVVSNHHWGQPDGAPEQSKGKARWPEVKDDFFLQLMLGCFVTLQGALVRTACYREVGGFDETLQTSEDYDMLLRLARRFPVVLLNEPTFVFRQHTGARGRADARYRADEREARFARNDALIGRRLRQELPLGDYLAPRRSELTAADRKAALINRMSVMASKGLLSELIEDALAFSQADDAAPEVTADERRQLVRAVQHRYLLLAINAQGSGFLREAQVLATTARGQAVLRSMARGMIGLARWSAGSNGERLAALSTASRLAALSLSKPHLEATY